MIMNFKDRKALKSIMKDNEGKIYINRGDKGEYHYEGKYGVAFSELTLPERLKYKAYPEHDGIQFYDIESQKGKKLGYLRISKD